MEQHIPTSRLDAVLFASPNPEALAEFYRQGFELEPPKWHGADHLGFNLSNTYLGFDRVGDEILTPRPAVSIWFRVTDSESTFQRLMRLGAKVKYPPTKEESPGEILAMLYDPDGNTIGLISPA
ncbi:MAG: hypothetical protein A2136_04195 [Chloroflexi bacterium RBG_16_54_11]|nr:MAG: hypothetical protein A2136_04195 [Chloroflexi bacterium RBG_16_54_11]